MMLVASVWGQEYNFRNLSVADGLPQSQVYAICQDSRGNIWFGTRGGGVSRYDGVAFTTFTEEQGLASNYVRAIIQDRAGVLWFGTDQGVSRYDGRRFAPPPNAPGLAGMVISSIAEDSTGALWFGSDQEGLMRYDRRGIKVFTRRDGLPSMNIFALFAGSDGALYVGTNRGMAVLKGDRESFAITGDSLLAGSTVTAFAEDSLRRIWIGTYGGGLFMLHGCVRKLDGVTLSNNTVQALYHGEGDIWVGTAGGGANRVNAATMRSTPITETEGLCNNVIFAIVGDSEGDIWFGSSGGGVSRYDGERFIHFTERQGKIGNWVYAIHQDRGGDIWFGNSAGGVARYNGTIYTRYSERDGFTAGKVKCIFEDDGGALWFGTVGDGLYTYNGSTFTHFSAVKGMRGRFINAIARDRRGNYWLATSDAGVVCYNPAATDPRRRFTYIGQRAGLGSSRVYDILADDDGNIWAATQGSGLGRITYRGDSADPLVRNFTVADGLSSNTIRTITRWGDRLLFGTGGGGIAVYDGERFRAIRKREGISSDNIYSLIADVRGQLWVGTERGIDRITIDSTLRVRGIRHYGHAEGVRGVETAQNASCLDREGNIWFGTIRGAVKYNPAADLPNNVPPQTHITEVRLFYTRIDSTGYADTLAPWYPLPLRLELPYDQNQLSFEFVGISQRNPERVLYQWMLEGFDEEWSPRSPQRSAVYSNLPPGTYTLRVRSFNGDGVPDPSPAIFSFTITPPFWGTWWFQTLASLVVATAIGLLFRARLVAVRRQSERERKEIEMEKDIVELQEKSLRLAMNPHFIFNALNSIQAFITPENTVVARSYLAKFARLMRAILENSRQHHVTVEEEIVMLRGYLELEKLNANGKFEYAIETGEGMDPASTMIPPMLVQPLVENAVLHGIRPKEGGGCITIRFDRAGDLLHCSVSDDGIGRQRASALRLGERTSTALGVIAERLAIINRQLGGDLRLVITDLYDDAGKPAGTRAELFLPYESDL